MSSRYAIYFVPPAESELYRFGSRLLGYDCYTATEIGHPKADGLPDDWADLTKAARRYGFHATLKAPFRLADSCDESSLVEALLEFGSRPHGIAVIRPVVASLSMFVAIVPQERSETVDDLAAHCVRHFDRFRAPLSREDRRRRLSPKVGAREQANVDRWGYPYVFDDFRFHMTLTGPLPDDRLDAIRAMLSARFTAGLGDSAITVDRIALLRQDHEGAPFRVLKEAVLGATPP